MRYIIDLATLAVIEGTNNLREVTTVSAKRGDSVPFEVSFLRDGVEVPLPTGTVLSFGSKEDGKYDGAAVVYQDEFTASTPATGTAALTAGAVSGITVNATGSGYSTIPLVTVSAPAAAVTATATAAISAGSVSGATVTQGGHYYASAPTVTLSPPDLATTATGTSTLTSGAVIAVTITHGGGFYTAAPAVTFSAPPTVVTATASATVDANAKVAWIAPVKTGGYYAAAPTVTVAAPAPARRAMGWVSVAPSGIGGSYNLDLGGILDGGSGYSEVPNVTVTPDVSDPTGADAVVEAVIAHGKVTGLIVVHRGNGEYTSRPWVTIDLPTVSTATATATISNGIVNGYTITDPGAGYMSPPAVIVAAPPNPAAATGTSTLTGGIVTGVTINSGGSGYITPPDVTIAAPTGIYTQAAAAATVSAGVVTAIDITTAGNGYITQPTITLSAPPASTPATAAAVIADDEVTALTITSPGSGYTSEPTVSIAAPPIGYHAVVSFNGEALSNLFLIDGNTGNDPVYRDLMSEFTWQLDENPPSSSKTFKHRVHNDVLRGNETTPLSQPTPEDWLEARRPAATIAYGDPINGFLQREVMQVSGTVTVYGPYKVIVTSVDLPGPVDVLVYVNAGNTAPMVAAAIIGALEADPLIAAAFEFFQSPTSASVMISRRIDAALDSTLNLSLQNEDSGGITPVANSTSYSGTAGTPGVLGQIIIVPASAVHLCIGEHPFKWAGLVGL